MADTVSFCLRIAIPQDAPQLFTLMRGLAVFEGYIDAFAVTEEAIRKHGFGANRLFTAHVADAGTDGRPDIVGIAVTFAVPWTYTLRPRLVLKELFVTTAARGFGVGRALMNAVIAEADAIGADRIVWTVMNGNTDAEPFYRAIGGQPDTKWNNWTLCLDTSGTEQFSG